MLDGVRTIVLKKENQTALCPKENHSSVLLVVSSFSRQKRGTIRSSIVELSDNSLFTEVRWKSPVSQPGRYLDCSLPASRPLSTIKWNYGGKIVECDFKQKLLYICLSQTSETATPSSYFHTVERSPKSVLLVNKPKLSTHYFFFFRRELGDRTWR